MATIATATEKPEKKQQQMQPEERAETSTVARRR